MPQWLMQRVGFHALVVVLVISIALCILMLNSFPVHHRTARDGHTI
jgi:cytochrome c biogenesis protein ResB